MHRAAGLQPLLIAGRLINTVGRIVPPRSILNGLEAAATASFQVLNYNGDRGPMLQHLGPLVAPADEPARCRGRNSS
jgi:hypothetical protein